MSKGVKPGWDSEKGEEQSDAMRAFADGAHWPEETWNDSSYAFVLSNWVGGSTIWVDVKARKKSSKETTAMSKH